MVSSRKSGIGSADWYCLNYIFVRFKRSRNGTSTTAVLIAANIVPHYYVRLFRIRLGSYCQDRSNRRIRNSSTNLLEAYVPALYEVARTFYPSNRSKLHHPGRAEAFANKNTVVA